MTFAPRQGIRRAGATAALAAAVLSTTAGCGYIHEQPTTFHYDPSDGISANVGSVKGRNLMVIANDAESDGRLLGTFLNDSGQDAIVTLDAGKSSATVKVKAHSETHLEDEETLLSPAGTAPGKDIQNARISVGSQSMETDIPVLDGALPEYKEYVPGGSSYTPPAKPTEGHEG